MREVLRWTAFPFFVIVPTAVAIAGLESGWAHRFTESRELADLILYFAVVVPTVVLIFAVERLIPFRDAWNRAQEDVLTDTLHMTTGYFLQSMNKLFVLWLGATAGAALTGFYGASPWPSSWRRWRPKSRSRS